MAGKGGARPGAGRKPGIPNKATASIREAAQQYTQQALETLANVMRFGESESAKVAAANSILDRGHGKPVQMISGDPEGPPVQFVIHGAPTR